MYTFDLSNIQPAARQVIAACGEIKIWLFEGEMGAGKTTLIKAICAELGVINTVQSPTFSIVNEYLTQKGDTIYHFDCYRLKNLEEAYDIGLEEYLDSANLCLIEWPGKITPLLPPDTMTIHINQNANNTRNLSVSKT
ncbi:MAG: tRNA (adenosine(37)-N6)-threonylcarbamoyltransferase complex ATPase subunit type 1 TsaE [Runella sp.]